MEGYCLRFVMKSRGFFEAKQGVTHSPGARLNWEDFNGFTDSRTLYSKLSFPKPRPRISPRRILGGLIREGSALALPAPSRSRSTPQPIAHGALGPRATILALTMATAENKFVAIGLGAVFALAPLAAVAQVEQLAQAAPAATPDTNMAKPAATHGTRGSHRRHLRRESRAAHQRARASAHHTAPAAPKS